MVKTLLILVTLSLIGWLGIVLFLILDKDKNNDTKKTKLRRNNKNNNK